MDGCFPLGIGLLSQHSCLARPNELPRKYLIKYNLARVGKKRLSCQELTKNDPIVTVIVIEPKSGSDIEDKG